MISRPAVLAMLFGLACIIALAGVRVADPYFVRTMRETAFDQFQRLSPRPFQETPVRIIDVDEASLRKFGQWPWPRSLMAELTLRLGEMGAAAIAFDMLFAEPDRLSPSRLVGDPALAQYLDQEQLAKLAGEVTNNDAIFADALSQVPAVLGFAQVSEGQGSLPRVKAGFAYTGAPPFTAVARMLGAARNLAPLDDAAIGLGSISLSPTESVSVVRKVPLVWSDGNALYPGLAIEALRVAMGVSTLVVHAIDDEGVIVQAIRVGDIDIPTTADGALWMRYSRENKERYISASAILSDAIDPQTVEKVAGHIVLIGTSAIGLHDIRATSVGENVPGVSIHAQLLEQVLTNTYVYRSDWVDGLELFGFIFVACFVVGMSLATGPLISFLTGGVLAAGLAVGTWLAYARYGLLFDPTFPASGGLFVYLAMTTFRYFIADRQKRQIRRAFTQYVAPAVLEQIEMHPETLALGGETREVTVLFGDIRDFTTLSERLTPVEVVQFLNALLSSLSRQIIAEEGTIDKFIGDCIMAFWNAPLLMPDHALHACRAALAMRRAVGRFNAGDEGRAATGWGRELPAISVGFGINTGMACVGNMGSESRFDYSAVGDTVNIASRVETASKYIAFDIVLSGTTAAGAETLAILSAGTIHVKGKAQTVPTFILVGDEILAQSRQFVELRDAHDRLMTALENEVEEREVEALIAACKELAQGMDAPLGSFYDRITEREDDFHEAPVPKIARFPVEERLRASAGRAEGD
ncbi:adenylate/guanylate cyclase domain-containing protein [Stappia sp. F7233]|uniref:Adenylate/guanylate cyclase domain-containing protein n=1 Tax=Stappia albiluteola TaxID=2758565 RepID=A0A839AH69_9HYPH|nr:adenylate/guanylate cyclase domain-containing protein [Stappia albiluteola]MBA5779200.1 adenylate/guanylate cyclase domain-containing protein [Stappia albiluteola]